jgi:hypothetical protein
MQIYLRLASIPELSGLARADALRIWRSTVWCAFLHWQTYVGFALMGLTVGVCTYIGSLFSPLSSIAGLAIVGIGGGIGGFLWAILIVAALRPHLGEARSRSHPEIEWRAAP